METGKISLNRSAALMYKLYQHNFRIIPACVLVYQIFFTEDYKQALSMILSCITSCKSHELWKLSTVLSTCHNWGLLITCAHKSLCFKKIRTTTTTAFLIFNTVVPNPYSLSTAFDSHSFVPLSFRLRLIDLSHCGIQMLYRFQIDNSIRECETAAELEFPWSIASKLDLLHLFSFQFIKNGSVAM